MSFFPVPFVLSNVTNEVRFIADGPDLFTQLIYSFSVPAFSAVATTCAHNLADLYAGQSSQITFLFLIITLLFARSAALLMYDSRS